MGNFCSAGMLEKQLPHVDVGERAAHGHAVHIGHQLVRLDGDAGAGEGQQLLVDPSPAGRGHQVDPVRLLVDHPAIQPVGDPASAVHASPIDPPVRDPTGYRHQGQLAGDGRPGDPARPLAGDVSTGGPQPAVADQMRQQVQALVDHELGQLAGQQRGVAQPGGQPVVLIQLGHRHCRHRPVQQRCPLLHAVERPALRPVGVELHVQPAGDQLDVGRLVDGRQIREHRRQRAQPAPRALGVPGSGVAGHRRRVDAARQRHGVVAGQGPVDRAAEHLVELLLELGIREPARFQQPLRMPVPLLASRPGHGRAQHRRLGQPLDAAQRGAHAVAGAPVEGVGDHVEVGLQPDARSGDHLLGLAGGDRARRVVAVEQRLQAQLIAKQRQLVTVPDGGREQAAQARGRGRAVALDGRQHDLRRIRAGGQAERRRQVGQVVEDAGDHCRRRSVAGQPGTLPLRPVGGRQRAAPERDRRRRRATVRRRRQRALDRRRIRGSRAQKGADCSHPEVIGRNPFAL